MGVWDRRPVALERSAIAHVQRAFALLLCLALLAAFAGPAGGVRAADVRLGYLDSAEHRRVVEALKASYERSGFDAQVTLVPVQENQAQTMLPQWLATGEIADVFYLPVEYVGALKGNRLLLPLDTLRWPSTPLRDLVGQFPLGIQLAFAEGGVPVGIPLTASASLFQYNESILSNAGVPPLDQFSREWSWHDLIEIGRRVARPLERRYLLDIDLEFAGVYFMVHGDVVTPDGRSSNVLNEANVEILQLARDAIHSERISLPPSQQSGEQRRFETLLLALNKVSAAELHPARVAQTRARLTFEWNTALWPRSPFSGARPALGQGAGLVVAWGARSLPDVSRLLDFAAQPATQLEVAAAAGVIPAAPAALPGLWSGASSASDLVALVMMDWQFFTFPVVIVQDVEALLAPIQAVLENVMEPAAALERVHLQFQEALDRAYRGRPL